MPYKSRPDIDVLIDNGFSLNEISTVLHNTLTRQGIRDYIHYSGQDKLWTEVKDYFKLIALEEKAQLPTERNILLNLIKNYGEQRSKKEGFAYENAWKYYFNVINFRGRQNPRTPKFKDFVEIYKKYGNMKRKGKSFSYESLARELNISTMPLYHYLNSLGLENDRRRNRLNADQLKIIKKSRSIKMNFWDLSYFTGIDRSVIQKYLKKRREKREIYVLGFNPDNFNDKTNYRTAAQTYEAIDLGFKKRETIELLDIEEKEFDYLYKNRKEIEYKIVEDLRKIYERRNIKISYQLTYK